MRCAVSSGSGQVLANGQLFVQEDIHSPFSSHLHPHVFWGKERWVLAVRVHLYYN
ncbi:hypothetical protein K9N68_19175 [Kovacikia minuta CCNUW1]|uniref:hypothetical protein n=1 Tax=Kovacikia minuta TaxID=2931930 RepID=UPI001CCB2804|nr:hypothetical protein [Kovacikia minuta]UBF23872.1 hypothetical protein K9N68_19175 [Kovacikia minuta CCNUW1]